MNYIIFPNSKSVPKLKPYIKTRLGRMGVLVDIQEEKVSWLKNQVRDIEPDFDLEMGHLFWHDLGVLAEKTIIVATLGKYFLAPSMHYTYDMESKHWEEQLSQPKQEAIWIHCYSKTEDIKASDCIRAIDKLFKLSYSLNKPLILVGNVKAKLPFFKTQSLAQRIVEDQLNTWKSVCVIQTTMDKGSIDEPWRISKDKKIRHTRASSQKVQKEIKKWLEDKADSSSDKRQNGQTLYDDSFYEQIPPNQQIYVPLSMIDDRDCDYYAKLGLETVCLGKQYTLIYEERRKIDSMRNELMNHVFPNFENPILSKAPIIGQVINPTSAYKVISQPMRYHGSSVYIGIVIEEGIDYTKEFLRSPSGNTRIAYYWVQNTGGKGESYTAQQIDAAIGSENPESVVPLQSGENYPTILLGLAGGKMTNYESVATQAEFLVAKVNTAPHSLQRIYGGKVEQPAVLMPDLLIGIYQLVDFARKNQKPIVLILPYNTNLSAHDGTGVYEDILEEIGNQTACSIVIPTGEEGNKSHHQTIAEAGKFSPIVNLQVSQMTESLVGAIYLRNTLQEPITLYPPIEAEKSVRLDEEGVYSLNSGTIYTSGIEDNYLSGARMVNFRIANMSPGTWKLERLPSTNYASAKIELWIGQESLNPYVTLSPSSPFITIGSNSALTKLITVGSYDPNNLVVLAASGRGFNWDEDVVPLCITRGIGETYNQAENIWYKIEGSVVAASFLAGSVAVIYEKWRTEVGIPYANSVIMKNFILSNLSQFTGTTYPNPSQGYGVFELEKLPSILNTTY